MSCGYYAERKSWVYGDSSVRKIGLCHLHKRVFWWKFITSQRINLLFDWKLSEVAFQIIECSTRMFLVYFRMCRSSWRATLDEKMDLLEFAN